METKTALVTGGAAGIGKAIALKFANTGFNVIIADIKQPSDELIALLKSHDIEACGIQVDVSDFEQTEKLVKEAKQKYGSIDVLVNNAGITRDMLLMRMTENDFDAVIKVNLKGTFNMTRHISSLMLKQKGGAIINIASIVGVMGNAGQANYAASKAGVIGLTKTTARELASRGITCNAVAPGFIATEMTDVLSEDIKSKMLASIPINRFGTPEEVAEVVHFLSVNRYITGQVVHINGGMLM